MGMVFQRKLLSKYYGHRIDYWDGSTINKPGPFVFLLTLESHRQITKLATDQKPHLFKKNALLYKHFGTGHAPVTSLVSSKIRTILTRLISWSVTMVTQLYLLGLEMLFLTIAGDIGELLGVILSSGAVRELA